MQVSQHAIERACQRLGLAPDEAIRTLIFIAENGHAPTGKEWDRYGIIPHWDLAYRCHSARMVIINAGLEVIVTVVVPYFPDTFRYPDLKALRGLSAQEALRRYRQNS